MNEPSTAATLLQQGLFHHRQGELALAMERYIDVLKTEPTNADALYYVAVVACQEGHYQQGIDLAKRAIEVGEPQARVHNLMGQAYDRLHQPLEAIKAYDAAIAINPNLAEAHGNRANILVDAGFPEEALKSFDRALALSPNPTDWLNRGALLAEMGKTDAAIDSYDKAIALAPDLSPAHRGRAVALELLGRSDEARVSNDTAAAVEAQAAKLNPE
jgi:tetratricopeptide (TPR) repeat protein